jgi:hypothetical protein
MSGGTGSVGSHGVDQLGRADAHGVGQLGVGGRLVNWTIRFR